MVRSMPGSVPALSTFTHSSQGMAAATSAAGADRDGGNPQADRHIGISAAEAQRRQVPQSAGHGHGGFDQRGVGGRLAAFAVPHQLGFHNDAAILGAARLVFFPGASLDRSQKLLLEAGQLGRGVGSQVHLHPHRLGEGVHRSAATVTTTR